jgi:cysteinyl-tRNA synthetase
LLLSTHYRQQFNFTFEGLEAAKSAVERLSNVMRRLQDADGKSSGDKTAQLVQDVERCFSDAMDDDLNVSVALASLFDFVREINNLLDVNNVSKQEAAHVYALLKGFDSVLGSLAKKKKNIIKEARI